MYTLIMRGSCGTILKSALQQYATCTTDTCYDDVTYRHLHRPPPASAACYRSHRHSSLPLRCQATATHTRCCHASKLPAVLCLAPLDVDSMTQSCATPAAGARGHPSRPPPAVTFWRCADTRSLYPYIVGGVFSLLYVLVHSLFRKLIFLVDYIYFVICCIQSD